MRSLLVRWYREGELYIKGAALQKADGVFARGTQDTLSLPKIPSELIFLAFSGTVGDFVIYTPDPYPEILIRTL
jgi:hypothetical protein